MSGLSGLTQSVMDHYSANSRNSVRLVDIFFYNLQIWLSSGSADEDPQELGQGFQNLKVELRL